MVIKVAHEPVPWARLSQLQVGDRVTVTGFDCMEGTRVVHHGVDGLWVKCSHGRHYLEGQLDFDDGDSLIGIYQAK